MEFIISWVILIYKFGSRVFLLARFLVARANTTFVYRASSGRNSKLKSVAASFFVPIVLNFKNFIKEQATFASNFRIFFLNATFFAQTELQRDHCFTRCRKSLYRISKEFLFREFPPFYPVNIETEVETQNLKITGAVQSSSLFSIFSPIPFLMRRSNIKRAYTAVEDREYIFALKMHYPMH